MLDVLRREDPSGGIDREFLERAVLFDDRRFADSKEQIGNALPALEHRAEQGIYNFCVHGERVGTPK